MLRQYNGDIRRYKKYCCSKGQIVGTEAMLDYLYISLIKQKIKKQHGKDNWQLLENTYV